MMGGSVLRSLGYPYYKDCTINNKKGTDIDSFLAVWYDTSILGSFMCSSIISMTKNKFSRFYDDHVLAAVACEFGMWISFLGANNFVGRAIYNTRVQMRNTMPQGFSAKVLLLVRMLFTIELSFWSVLYSCFVFFLRKATDALFAEGAIAYIAEQPLVGGFTFLIGSLLYVSKSCFLLINISLNYSL